MINGNPKIVLFRWSNVAAPTNELLGEMVNLQKVNPNLK
jgi:hypothetical protein